MGSIWARGEELIGSTVITRTILGQTKDLAFVRDATSFSLEESTFIRSLYGLHKRREPNIPTVSDESSGSQKGLKATVEELFQNFTVSLLAELSLQ